MIKGVIFDLDGTLLDTLEDLSAAGNAVLQRHGLAAYPKEAYRLMVGNGIPRLVRRMLTGTDARSGEKREQEAAAMLPAGLEEAALSDFMAYYAAHKQDHTRPYPGIKELLMRLQAEGVRLAVVSNKADSAVKELAQQYFGAAFTSAVGLKEGGRAKPDPASTLEAVKRLALPKEQILYVGDSDVDMQTAYNAGLAGCGVLWGFRTEEELKKAGARYLAPDAQALYEIISSTGQSAF
ncbi:MAG: HAD family hydrolase [Lachnospiraceae bacterium]|jgi:phosphoglycolate phosphatase|nr:HAD family hydrolase [Lachnospiraceae bacterium]